VFKSFPHPALVAAFQGYGNSPVWSLFAEIVVNVIWSLLAKFRANVGVISVSAVICGLFSLWYISDHGVKPLEFGRFLGPMARMLFAFLVGVLLYNFHSEITKRIPIVPTRFFFLGIALVVILGMQWFGVVWDVISIYLLLPIVLACGIAAGIAAGIQWEAGIRKFLGDLS
jgi:peptidoglycan/LPS O-acetylase OafA/YrhL